MAMWYALGIAFFAAIGTFLFVSYSVSSVIDQRADSGILRVSILVSRLQVSLKSPSLRLNLTGFSNCPPELD